jgi:hypothetical protein
MTETNSAKSFLLLFCSFCKIVFFQNRQQDRPTNSCQKVKKKYNLQTIATQIKNAFFFKTANLQECNLC